MVATSISHFLTAATKFPVVPPTENVSFVFLSLALALFLDKLRWPFALLSLYLCLSLSLFPKFVGMTVNLNVGHHGYKKKFRFPFSSLLTL